MGHLADWCFKRFDQSFVGDSASLYKTVSTDGGSGSGSANVCSLDSNPLNASTSSSASGCVHCANASVASGSGSPGNGQWPSCMSDGLYTFDSSVTSLSSSSVLPSSPSCPPVPSGSPVGSAGPVIDEGVPESSSSVAVLPQPECVAEAPSAEPTSFPSVPVASSSDGPACESPGLVDVQVDLAPGPAPLSSSVVVDVSAVPACSVPSSHPMLTRSKVFHRTVTNVGSAVSTYKVIVKAPPGLVIQVQPSVLSFKSLGQKLSFAVTVGAEVGNSMISGALIWDDGVHQVYIVYMGDLPKGDVSISDLHIGMLQDVVPSAASDLLVYSYRRSFNGFAAKLTADEANKMKGKEGVVSVFLSQKKQLHTSRSWEFMGYNKKMKRSVIESDIIVGMLDTGIWPESESFNDTGFGPIPYRWKGTCQNLANFTCNKKIIGARYYLTDGENGPEDFISPRDAEGHGTHTSSIAAGGLVSHANLYGIARGTARGGVPSARIAVYKICWSEGCSDQDILAAFDDAIADGVDIISLSVGSVIPMDYFEDPIAIGAFHAMKNGILTSNSAGNGGPALASVTNLSPWSLSVAASTIDRKFVAKVQLGNGQIYEGATINIFDLEGKMYPFIYGGEAPNATIGPSASYYSRFCFPGSLNSTLVKGKIVFCEYFTDPEGVMQAGAAGAVFQETGYKDYQFSYPLPLSTVNMNDGRMILNYLNTTENPTATIFRTTQDNNQFAPFVVSFSSRGPNPITADILKPDLTAPGVDILAAWSEAASVSDSEGDTHTTKYNIISGTSMSCPHATGAAAYVKSFHPTWSPAAIRSALMTTAMPMTSNNNIDAEFAYGAGHINPLQAIDPGLVYDAGEIDYVKFLCGQGYTVTNIQLISGNSSSCSDDTNGTVWDLNYPSFALSSTPGKSVTRVFHRTVTNVGRGVSTYIAVINAPPGLIIQVQPSVLSFEHVGQTQSFVVTVAAELGNSIISGSLIWDDGDHKVKSPIVAYASILQ
ncbi:hypothetical protein HRI_002388200 [Hibiscus trionum]|uniref:Cucumisin n=1 Tax=Hibiscus trionum TaxID=183268 RepID=A0A9W7I2Z4_HIBTR|nr:hypothetical protein HRI_002388200 [Hibiscus trionum]